MPRQLIEPQPHKGDKRYVRRNKGKFTTKQVKVGRSLVSRFRSSHHWWGTFVCELRNRRTLATY
jgi:hypothetical protein